MAFELDTRQGQGSSEDLLVANPNHQVAELSDEEEGLPHSNSSSEE